MNDPMYRRAIVCQKCGCDLRQFGATEEVYTYHCPDCAAEYQNWRKGEDEGSQATDEKQEDGTLNAETIKDCENMCLDCREQAEKLDLSALMMQHYIIQEIFTARVVDLAKESGKDPSDVIKCLDRCSIMLADNLGVRVRSVRDVKWDASNQMFREDVVQMLESMPMLGVRG